MSKITRSIGTSIHSIMLMTLLLMVSTQAQSSEARLLTKEIANNTAIYAMMASNVYVDESEKTQFPLERLGWRKLDERGVPVRLGENSYRPKSFAGDFFSNLQFDIWEDSNSDKTVFAFKGTEEKLDWINGNLMLGVAIPYKSAKKHVAEYIKTHPGRIVIVTGHSLGGGIALSVSFWQGVDAVVFNTSPRIFDGLRNSNNYAMRLAIFQVGDILQKIRHWYPKFLEKINPDQIVEANFDYSGRNTHRSDLIAEGLLSCSTDPSLRDFATSLKVSVNCPIE